MLSQHDLRERLLRLDRRGYRSYRDIEGSYDFGRFVLSIDHAQSDPFAPPSRLRVRLADPGYPPDVSDTGLQRIALADYLGRAFCAFLHGRDVRDLSIDAGGQEVLERTAAVVTEGYVEVRLTARLPGAGRTILGREAARLLTESLPRAVLAVLPWEAVDGDAARRHVQTVEDAHALRDGLSSHGLVAFVADGALLPRLSGSSDLPLRDRVVLFSSPPELRVDLQTPHTGTVSGMGIPSGITLIVGGGYHGKTTLLQALQVGVYDHIPGDGRERVVTVAGAVKVRSEDGRRVERVDISPFLTNLPFDVDTTQFSSDDASGSTSQAASIMESVEVGTSLLLLDEDTSATNFMVRDELMQQLVPKELEPITPFIDRVRQLRDLGISTVLVVGGDGDYFEVADRVIMMAAYQPRDVTERAHQIARERKDLRRPEAPDAFRLPIPRIPLPASLNAETGRGRTRVRATDLDEIRFGREEIDLWTIDQLVDRSQTRAIGLALLYLVQAGYLDGRRTLTGALELLERDMDEHGLDVITSGRYDAPPGDLARPRRHEIAAALNRLRSLRVEQQR